MIYTSPIYFKTITFLTTGSELNLEPDFIIPGANACKNITCRRKKTVTVKICHFCHLFFPIKNFTFYQSSLEFNLPDQIVKAFIFSPFYLYFLRLLTFVSSTLATPGTTSSLLTPGSLLISSFFTSTSELTSLTLGKISSTLTFLASSLL